MKVGNVALASVYSSQKSSNNVNFKGYRYNMIDDKIVKEILKSIPISKKPENFSEKIVGSLKKFFSDAKKHRIDVQGKHKNISYVYYETGDGTLGEGILRQVHRKDDNVLLREDYLCLKPDFLSYFKSGEGYTTFYRKNNGKVEIFRDKDGKLKYLELSKDDRNYILVRGKSGNIAYVDYPRVNICDRKTNGINGRISTEKGFYNFISGDIRHFNARENLSIKSLKSIINYSQWPFRTFFRQLFNAKCPKEYEATLCMRWRYDGDDANFIGGTVLPKGITIDDIIRMHKTGELQNIKFDLKHAWE